MIRAELHKWPQQYVPPIELRLFINSPDEAAALYRALVRDAEPALEDARVLLKSLLK